MKMVVTIVSTNLVANSLLSLFCPPSLETKNMKQALTKLVPGNKKYFCFCLWRVVPNYKAIPNSIYKHIFLHVIAAGFIVP